MSTRPIAWCGLVLALEVCTGFALPGPQDLQVPTSVSTEQLLSAGRQYASLYMARLPSFICTQTTEQFEADKKAKHWRKGDRLTSQLVWDQGREQRTLQLINNRPISRKSMWRSPLVSEGEFGGLLESVLGNSSQAAFSWQGWDRLGDKRVGVFGYRVDRQHSSFRLSFGPAETAIGFHGTFYIDENTGIVWRINDETHDIPQELRTRSISRSVDYGEVEIGGVRYVLPVHASILLDTGSANLRNDLKFDAYRKFASDSRISFSSAESARTGPGDPLKQ